MKTNSFYCMRLVAVETFKKPYMYISFFARFSLGGKRKLVA